MRTIEEIQEKLKTRNLTVMSELTGIKYVTLSTIKKGTNKNPSYNTLIAIEEFLKNDQP